MSDGSRARWKIEGRPSTKRKALAIVEKHDQMIRDVDTFPANVSEARIKLALAGLDAALLAPTSAMLTREQLAAAVLLGRGLTYAEVAEALGISEGHVHLWDRAVPGFRNEIAIWREALELDVQGRLYRDVAEMMQNGELADTDRIRLLSLAEKISSKPEDRARYAAELRIKREQLEINRKQAGKGDGGERDPRVVAAVERSAPDGYRRLEALEGDFEVEGDGDVGEDL